MHAVRTISPTTRRTNVSDVLAAACAAIFVVILAVSAYWDPTIRVLHVFEAIPYVAAGALCLRRHKFGYLLGAASGAFWLWCAGTLTTFVRNGFDRLALLIRTGTVDRPDVLIAVPAAMATGGLVLFSAWGYSRLRSKSWADLVRFIATFALVFAFFLAIFALFAPRYLGMFRRLLG
jgi:hypothetical protein